MHYTVALTAVFIGRILDADLLGGQLAIRIKSCPIPGVAICSFFYQPGPNQCRRGCPAKFTFLQRFDPGGIVRVVKMTQEAVHLDNA